MNPDSTHLTELGTKFARDGALVVDNVLDEGTQKRLNNAIDELVERSRSVTHNDGTFVLEPDHTPENPRLRRIVDPVDRDPVFLEVMRSDAILDIVEQLLGPNIRFMSSELNMKAPGGGAAVAWHQDYPFEPYSTDEWITCGLALEDATLENGCLMGILGSHRGPILDHHAEADGVFVGSVSPDVIEVRSATPTPLLVKAGGMTIHHSRTLHASETNRSTKSRRLLLFRYVAAHCVSLTDTVDPDYLAQGVVRGTPSKFIRMMGGDVLVPRLVSKEETIFESQDRLESAAVS